ncbi:S9 family peptidase [Candidatus Zixiibacteriota bacterium]
MQPNAIPKRFFLLGILSVFIVISSCSQPVPPTPPVARVIPRADTLHGDVRIDNYFWLRQRSDPEVLEYLEAENEYTRAVMRHTEKLQQRLFEEMKGRIKETDLSVPARMDDYFYYTRTEQGKQYPVYCRKKASLEAAEEVLLDQNVLAEGKDYCDIWAFKITPDHSLLAYSVDTTGQEIYTIYIRDLAGSGEIIDHIDDNYGVLEWANDNRTIFYITMDEAFRPYKLHRHQLGDDQGADALIFHERDNMFYMNLSKTRSEEYLLLKLESKITSEYHFLDAHRPLEELKIVQPRRHGVEYSVDHRDDTFYILTNDHAVNFKLMRAPVERPLHDRWEEIIAHRQDVTINDVDLFENHLVLWEREGGLKRVRIMDLRDGQIHNVEFPEPIYTVWPEENPEFRTGLLRFTYTSLVTPESIFDYNLDVRTRELMKQKEVLGGYDPTGYRSERVMARAADGTMVPISLVYKEGLVRDGTAPLYLLGYGSYGSTIEPRFSSNRLSLLDRGIVYARAHIRGGGEMGREWYQEGKLLKKMNTFTDFIACAEHLIAEKYTSADRLVAVGGSAGGLLAGVVSNLRPDLFGIIVADVPFVDVINTMMDPTIPLTVIEYEEWGNPNDKEYYDYMSAYSPYDNVEAKDYPDMLVTAGLNDPRVQYWEPAKWVARLRSLKTDQNRLLLKTNMGAGHHGQSGRYDYLKEIAFEYAFILDRLDLEE